MTTATPAAAPSQTAASAQAASPTAPATVVFSGESAAPVEKLDMDAFERELNAEFFRGGDADTEDAPADEAEASDEVLPDEGESEGEESEESQAESDAESDAEPETESENAPKDEPEAKKAEGTIPKDRFDEVIKERNQMRSMLAQANITAEHNAQVAQAWGEFSKNLIGETISLYEKLVQQLNPQAEGQTDAEYAEMLAPTIAAYKAKKVEAIKQTSEKLNKAKAEIPAKAKETLVVQAKERLSAEIDRVVQDDKYIGLNREALVRAIQAESAAGRKVDISAIAQGLHDKFVQRMRSQFGGAQPPAAKPTVATKAKANPPSNKPKPPATSSPPKPITQARNAPVTRERDPNKVPTPDELYDMLVEDGTIPREETKKRK